MPSAVSPNPQVGVEPPDDLDRMLDYENAVEDFLNDIPVRDDNAQVAADQPRDEDQEVQVKRKRKPVPKLDEERLLSEAGLPKLRRVTKNRLKFRGKHHEFSDISKLLNTYQLWLDDLYPRAKFRDALTMIEKLGHTKRMQVMRRAWLDSTKPNRIDPTSAVEETVSETDTPAGGVEHATAVGDHNSANNSSDRMRGQDKTKMIPLESLAPGEDEPGLSPTIESGVHEPDEDELDALLAENEHKQPSRETIGRRVPFEDDEDDEDGLDALLAEQLSGELAGSSSNTRQPRLVGAHDEFADEEEVMAEMEGAW